MKYFVNIILMCLLGINIQAQEKNAKLSELEQQAKNINQVPVVVAGDQVIHHPTAPEGYRLILMGTDRPQVVNIRGEISTPLVSASVQLYYQLMDLSNGNRSDVPNIKITIPGEYRGSESKHTCPAVIPSLREWYGTSGYLKLNDKGRIIIDENDKGILSEAMEVFAEDITFFGGRNFQLKTGKSLPGAIYVSLNCDDKALGEEGYRISIDDRITLKANTTKGIFMGTRTILQLLDIYDGNIPKGQIRDYPKYKRRGFMLDVGRKFFKMAFLKDYVRIMSYYKMNEFQIHLNDNGFKQFFENDWGKTYAAFRLQSDTFPGLTATDGYYTKQDFTDLQLMGMHYGVNIIPEIDVPAHSLAFTRYRPSIGSEQYGMDHLDINNPETYEFVDQLFDEYLGGDNPVFIGPDVHIGTDEYAKEEAESFRQFTDHYLKRIQGYGKRARLWGALTHADGVSPVTADNVIMNAWYNGYADPVEMVKQGYELVSTPDGYLYIVPAAGYYYDYLDLDLLFNKWEPNSIGKAVFPYGHPAISGGMFAVWNDHCGNGISEKDVHHRAFPALQVLAQQMWMGKDTTLTIKDFKHNAKQLIEAPFVNVMGKVASKSDVVIAYDFKTTKTKDTSGNSYNLTNRGKAKWGKGSGYYFSGQTYMELPVEEIAYPYEVSFTLSIDSDILSEKVLFTSENAQVVINPENDKVTLGFKRDGYFYSFKYLINTNKPVSIAVKGDNKGTSLLIDGKEVERLQGLVKEYKDTRGKVSKMYIQQTLVFPLRKIGARQNGFKGTLHSVKVRQL